MKVAVFLRIASPFNSYFGSYAIHLFFFIMIVFVYPGALELNANKLWRTIALIKGYIRNKTQIENLKVDAASMSTKMLCQNPQNSLISPFNFYIYCIVMNSKEC